MAFWDPLETEVSEGQAMKRPPSLGAVSGLLLGAFLLLHITTSFQELGVEGYRYFRIVGLESPKALAAALVLM